jgi:hypothetical protein
MTIPEPYAETEFFLVKVFYFHGKLEAWIIPLPLWEVTDDEPLPLFGKN